MLREEAKQVSEAEQRKMLEADLATIE